MEEERIINMVRNYQMDTFECGFDPKDKEEVFELFRGEEKAGNMIATLNVANDWTRNELRNLLTVDEAWCMLRAVQGSIYDPTRTPINPKEFLLIMIEDRFIYEPHDDRSVVGIKTITDKLKGLTQFQAYTLITMYYALINSTEDYFTVEDIKKVFLID